jgi:prepilin-type N-terminal cleavage/methylation domain-containing protein/prepilin-type processing-associated H-X9-DG protein
MAGTAMRRFSGFTLIELLVVIAIISLLVSILLPSLSKAKELAYRAVCSTNLHSIVLAQEQYCSDYDGYFPAIVLNEGDREGGAVGAPFVEMKTWDVALEVYTDTPTEWIACNSTPTSPVDSTVDLFSCPGDQLARSFGRKRSYSRMRPNWERWEAHYLYHYPSQREDYPDPSMTFFLCEWQHAYNVRRCNWLASMGHQEYITGWSVTPDLPPPMDANHNGEGSNFVFIDGHLEWLTPDLVDDDVHWPQYMPQFVPK